MLSALCTPDFLSRKKVKVSKLRGVGSTPCLAARPPVEPLQAQQPTGSWRAVPTVHPPSGPSPRADMGPSASHCTQGQHSRPEPGGGGGGDSRGRPSLGSGKGPAGPATPLPGHDASRAPAEKRGAANQEHRAGHREVQNFPHVKWPFAEVQVTGDHGLAKGLSEQSNWAGWEGDTLSTSPF